MIPSPKLQLHYGTKTIEYSIIKSKRIKTSEIIVDANIVVRTPFHKPTSEVHDIIRKKVDWILKKQIEYRVNNSQIIKPTFQHGSTLPYLGKNYPLHIISNQETDEKINFVNGEFLVHIKEFKYSKKRIKLLYEEWLVNGVFFPDTNSSANGCFKDRHFMAKLVHPIRSETSNKIFEYNVSISGLSIYKIYLKCAAYGTQVKF